MQEVALAPASHSALVVPVRAYGAQRGALAEHIEESIESALRACGGGAAGIGFDTDAGTRLSDQLFRARRAGFPAITIRLSALRALCAPVGGLDAADAQAIVFYVRATEERPVELVLDAADRELPAFVVARRLAAVIEPGGDADADANANADANADADAPSVSLASVIAMGESESESESEAEPEPETEAETETEAELEVDTRWRECAAALEAARGPQTLAAFERLFVQSYLPLAAAVDHGVADGPARDAREEFRRTFSRAYSEALPTFVLTGKRPRMVLDAFDIAARMARSHNARHAQVLVVDGMRFDLAARIAGRVAELLDGRASLADRVTLFAALPSTTPRQFETLARGIEGLKSTSDREAEPLRGRTADAVRRIRVGSRDLYKLDLVETTLAQAGENAIGAIDDIVEETARSIAKHGRAQGSRTLLFVLGDHGFRFDGGAAKHGGASPEEVIVSGHAFLVGDLH